MPASSSARRFHSPESSPNHSNIHSWVPSGLVTNPSRDITILRTTCRSAMELQTRPLAENNRPLGGCPDSDRRRFAGEFVGDAVDGVVEARVLVGAPVGHQGPQRLACRVFQALGDSLATVGERV